MLQITVVICLLLKLNILLNGLILISLIDYCYIKINLFIYLFLNCSRYFLLSFHSFQSLLKTVWHTESVKQKLAPDNRYMA